MGRLLSTYISPITITRMMAIPFLNIIRIGLSPPNFITTPNDSKRSPIHWAPDFSFFLCYESSYESSCSYKAVASSDGLIPISLCSIRTSIKSCPVEGSASTFQDDSRLCTEVEILISNKSGLQAV